MKSIGSELAFIRVLRLGLGNVRAVSAYVTDGRLRKTSDFFGKLQTSLGIFRSCRFQKSQYSQDKNLYFRKRWQVYESAGEGPSNPIIIGLDK